MDYTLYVIALLTIVSLAPPELARGEWPLPGHDNRHLAQAELPCNMPEAPKEVWSYDLGPLPYVAAMCADVDDDGEDEVLYRGWPLVCVSLSGEEKWRSSCGQALAIADIDGDGRTELLTSGPRIVSGHDGQVLWTRTGPPGVSGICCAKLLPDVKGLQVAVLSHDYATMTKHAQVWSFAEGCDKAELVWGRDFDTWEHSGLTVGRFDENTMCLISPTWGGFSAMDARDGSELMRLYWENAPGVSGLRNYGPLTITDMDGDGRSEYVVLATSIAQHIDVIALWRGSPGEHSDRENPWPAPDVPRTELASYADGPLLWQRYFGTNYPTEDYLFKVPTSPIADVDGDGQKEIVATLGKERWELKVYDGMSGVEKLSLPDVEAEMVVDLDGDDVPEIIARQGDALVIGSLRQDQWLERLRVENCRLAYSKAAISPSDPAGVYVVEQRPVGVQSDTKRVWVAVQDTSGDGRADKLLFLSAGPNAAFDVIELPLDNASGLSVLAASEQSLIATTNDGQMLVMDPQGHIAASWPCSGPFISGASVADIDGDGANEMLVGTSRGKVVALRPSVGSDQAPRLLWQADGAAVPVPGGLAMPLIADLNGDGEQEILVTCKMGRAKQGARLLDCRGQTIWETEIPVWRAIFGDFNGDGHLDVYAAARMRPKHHVGTNSVYADTQSFALDGRDGSVLWCNDGSDERIWHHLLGPYHQPATVADINGDGCDDVLFTALDLCIVLSGKDGSFIHEPVIANRIWEQEPGKSEHWTAYGTQIPVDLDGDGELEILLAASWGQWGAWTLDRELIWTFDPGKAEMARRNPGIADVDGDGKLEFGVIHDGGFFRCYDAATGTLKWELEGIKQTTDVVTADVDGDGLPEFLAGLAAYKAIDQSHGKVLWEVQAPAAGSPLVADVDGDGLCEIVLPCSDGKIRAYK